MQATSGGRSESCGFAQLPPTFRDGARFPSCRKLERMKTSPVVIVLSGDFEKVSIGGEPAVRVGTVTRADFEGLVVGGGIAVGSVQPTHAAEVGLSGGPERLPGGRERQSVTLHPTPTPALLERGQLIVDEARSAVARKDLGRLRQLCWWFPLVLRMPEVKAFLDGLPRPRAEQVAGRRPGQGRPYDPVEAFGRIATMTALARERCISIAESARVLAGKVPDLNVTPRGLENLHAELGDLVSCLDGYAIPASALSTRPWGTRGEDELPVYMKAPKE